MSDSAEVARFIVALFVSGIFWLIVLFFVETVRWRDRGLARAPPLRVPGSWPPLEPCRSRVA